MLTKTHLMKTNYQIVFVVLTFFVLITASCKLSAQSEKVEILPTDDLKEILTKTVSNEGLQGIVAAIIDSSGVVKIASAGIRKKESTEPITDQDKLHLGSCTKAMTSAMLALLVEEGKLNWESTIGEIFEEVRDSIHADYHDVTLHQLVRHRGGVDANAINWWKDIDLEIKATRKAIIIQNLKKESKQRSGDFLYSNLGYMIAGAMAEQVTGQSWEELMTQKLFVPLGMSSAGFGPPGTKDQIDQPWGHSNTWFSGWTASQGDNAAALGPAGTVHCSMEDWGKFVAFQFLDKSQELLSHAQLNNLKTPDGDYAAGWATLERPWTKGTAFTHSGSNTMWLSVARVAPAIGKAYLVVTNAYGQNTHQACDGVIDHLLKIDGALD